VIVENLFNVLKRNHILLNYVRTVKMNDRERIKKIAEGEKVTLRDLVEGKE